MEERQARERERYHRPIARAASGDCKMSSYITPYQRALHAQFEGIITVLLRKSCGSAKPSQREKLRARALHDENGRGGPMMPPGCCSRFVWPTWSTSLLARAPIVVCSRGSQQKYCVSLSEKSWCDSSVCDEYTFFVLAKWLGIHLTRVHGPSSDQSALLEALISRFRF